MKRQDEDEWPPREASISQEIDSTFHDMLEVYHGSMKKMV